MKLKSFGCSFIYGNDLHDDGRDEDWSTPSAYTWPGVIATRLSVEYQCFAKAGSGNLQILDKILTHVAIEDTSTVYVIGWTWSDRFDFVATDPDPRWRDDWRTICPITNSKIADHYYRELHSELRDKLSTLIHINTAIDILREKNIPFVMTYMDDIIFDRQWHAPLSVYSLQDRVRPHMHNFDGKTFLDWSRDNSFEISATNHPLEPAHVAAADYMFDRVSAEFNKLAQSTQ
jgi:hypothetical protein